jgi:hypothetical protein
VGTEEDALMYCITANVPRLESRVALREFTKELDSKWVPPADRDQGLRQPWGGYEREP